MITLIGFVYDGERPIYLFPLYSRNDWTENCIYFMPFGWLESSVPHSQSLSSLSLLAEQSLTEDFSLSSTTTASTTTPNLDNSCLKSSSKSITTVTGNGFKENPVLFHIDQWCLTKYNLTLYQLVYVFKEIRYSRNFRRSISKREIIPRKFRKEIISLASNNTHDLYLHVKFNVKDYHSSPIDWCGNYLILALVYIKLRIEETLSILSTLGGAYSSLGEHYEHFAIKAGQTSLKQIGLACLTGDPTVIARCSIYMVYSLCQRGLRIQAKRLLIRFIFPYINKMIMRKTCDNVIQNMYKAAKFRVEHYYKT